MVPVCLPLFILAVLSGQDQMKTICLFLDMNKNYRGKITRSKTKNFGIVVIGVLFLIGLTGIVHLWNFCGGSSRHRCCGVIAVARSYAYR